jgi:PAS domain S-box-containing protein
MKESEILRLLPSPIGYIDSNLIYQYVNLAYERSIGKPASDIVNKHVSEVLGEQALKNVQHYVDVVLSGQQVRFTNTLQTPSGTKHLDVIFTPDADASGKVRGFTSLVHDVTKQQG